METMPEVEFGREAQKLDPHATTEPVNKADSNNDGGVAIHERVWVHGYSAVKL